MSNVTGESVGIDLGTTYSCVGVWQNDRVEIIANDQGNRTTPSYVAFNETERLIGDAAKNQVAMNAFNTVFDAKRLIGRKFTDAAVQSDMKHWPFKVTSGIGGKPTIHVQYRGEEKTFAAEEISSMVLIKMKEIAEAYLGACSASFVLRTPSTRVVSGRGGRGCFFLRFQARFGRDSIFRPNGPKVEKETTHVILRWPRVASTA